MEQQPQNQPLQQDEIFFDGQPKKITDMSLEEAQNVIFQMKNMLVEAHIKLSVYERVHPVVSK